MVTKKTPKAPQSEIELLRSQIALIQQQVADLEDLERQESEVKQKLALATIAGKMQEVKTLINDCIRIAEEADVEFVVGDALDNHGIYLGDSWNSSNFC